MAHGPEGGGGHHTESSTGTHGGFLKESGTYAFMPFKIISDFATGMFSPKAIEAPLSEVGGKIAEVGGGIAKDIIASTGAPVEGGGGGKAAEHH